jgi:hypothetical protein
VSEAGSIDSDPFIPKNCGYYGILIDIDLPTTLQIWGRRQKGSAVTAIEFRAMRNWSDASLSGNCKSEHPKKWLRNDSCRSLAGKNVLAPSGQQWVCLTMSPPTEQGAYHGRRCADIGVTSRRCTNFKEVTGKGRVGPGRLCRGRPLVSQLTMTKRAGACPRTTKIT